MRFQDEVSEFCKIPIVFNWIFEICTRVCIVQISARAFIFLFFPKAFKWALFLSIDLPFAKIGVDTTESKPCNVWPACLPQTLPPASNEKPCGHIPTVKWLQHEPSAESSQSKAEDPALHWAAGLYLSCDILVSVGTGLLTESAQKWRAVMRRGRCIPAHTADSKG